MWKYLCYPITYILFCGFMEDEDEQDEKGRRYGLKKASNRTDD